MSGTRWISSNLSQFDSGRVLAVYFEEKDHPEEWIFTVYVMTEGGPVPIQSFSGWSEDDCRERARKAVDETVALIGSVNGIVFGDGSA